MNQTRFDVKRNFLSRTFSRCLAEMCPGVVRLEYHAHDNGDEVVIIRCVDGSTAGWTSRDGIFSGPWRQSWRRSTGRWRDAVHREAPPALGILAGGRRLGAAGCMDPDGMGPGVGR